MEATNTLQRINRITAPPGIRSPPFCYDDMCIYVCILRVYSLKIISASRLSSWTTVACRHPPHAPPSRDDEEDQEDFLETKDRFGDFWCVSSGKRSRTSSVRNLAPFRLPLSLCSITDFFVIASFLPLLTFSVYLAFTLDISPFSIFSLIKYCSVLSPCHFLSTRLSIFFSTCLTLLEYKREAHHTIPTARRSK